MKKYLLIILILLSIPSISFAEEDWKDWKEKCGDISNLAYVIMKARQNGVPMQELMEKIAGKKIFESMVIEAYDSPRYNTEEYQTEAENDFRDEWYLACSKSLSEEKK